MSVGPTHCARANDAEVRSASDCFLGCDRHACGRPACRSGPGLGGGTPRATLAGQVIAETGKPLSGAELIVDSAWYARSDTDGRFKFKSLPSGRHTMRVRAIGFEPLELDVRLEKALRATS